MWRRFRNELITNESNQKLCLKMPSLPSSSFPDGSHDTCELFEICEMVADRYRRACASEPNVAKVLFCLERQIMDYYEFNQLRAARLIELSLELVHLKKNGDYHTSELEVGRMICEVTDGWLEPGFN